jgi:hypothetical protein
LLPFNIASQAGLLIIRYLFAVDYGIQCRAEVFSGNRNVIAGAAVVELTAINKLQVFVENIKI